MLRRAKIGAVSERANGDEELDAFGGRISSPTGTIPRRPATTISTGRRPSPPDGRPGIGARRLGLGPGSASGASPAYRGVPEAAEGVDAGRTDPIEAGWPSLNPYR